MATVYSATWDEPGRHWLKQAASWSWASWPWCGIFLVPPKFFYAMAYPA